MAKRVPDAVEKQFNDDGIFFLESKSLWDVFKKDEKFIFVTMEMRIPETTTIPEIDFSYSVVNRRDVAIVFSNFTIVKRDGHPHLQFLVATRIPDTAALETFQTLPPVGMSFIDFCFYSGNEAIPENYADDVYSIFDTLKRKEDLGWYLPIRFCDPLIEALDKMNNSVFAGMLQDSIMYGPNAGQVV